jgi:hypothetical protein
VVPFSRPYPHTRQPFCGKDRLIIADLERLLIWLSLRAHCERMCDGRSSVFKASGYNWRGAIDDEENTKTVPSHRVTAIPLTIVYFSTVGRL